MKDSMLEEIGKIIEEGRPKYGEADIHFDVVASFWTNYLSGKYRGRPAVLTAADIPVMMQLLKIGRIVTGTPIADNQIDVTGYGNLYQKLMGLDTCSENREKPASSSAVNSGRKVKGSTRRGWPKK